jgi:dTDP-4-amino-4,6-dideoxygalactose transaminase
VDKYTWVDIGSSYLPGELIAAFLYAQLEEAAVITRARMSIWENYNRAFVVLSDKELLRTPVIPRECVHNAHMYYLLLRSPDDRTRLIAAMREQGILSVFHYIPLHSSPAGRRYCRISGSMTVTDTVSERLVRLPLYGDMTSAEQLLVLDAVSAWCNGDV